MADILRMIVVLSALCGLSGFALSYLKMVTAPVIEEQVLTYVQGPAIAGVFTDIDNQPIADRKAFETEKGRVLVFPAMRDGKLVASRITNSSASARLSRIWYNVSTLLPMVFCIARTYCKM